MQNVTETGAGTRFQVAWLPRVMAVAAVCLVGGALYLARTQIPATRWYSLLSVPSQVLTGPISDAADAFNIPLLSALLFGLLGAASPCQLTTNASALAFLAGRSNENRGTASSALAYVLGKALVYSLLGAAVIVAGRELAQRSIPVFVITRKALGPLMILIGLALLDLLPLRFSIGHGVAAWLRRRAGSGTGGAFLLGTAFSFAFCPTLFLLFFGLTIPLALRSPLGVIYPALFALGTTLPLLGLVGLLVGGFGTRKGYVTGVRRVDAWLRPVAALVLVLAGLNDIVTYWFL
jgi:cytochrome c-type biogenesis protein